MTRYYSINMPTQPYRKYDQKDKDQDKDRDYRRGGNALYKRGGKTKKRQGGKKTNGRKRKMSRRMTW